MSSIIWSRLDLVAKMTALKFQEIHLGSWLKQRWLLQVIGRELHLLRIAGYPQNGFVAFCRRTATEKRDLCKKNTNQVGQQKKLACLWFVLVSTVQYGRSMIHAKHPLAKFKVLPFRRSFMQVPPAKSCLAIQFVCIPGQKGGAINHCPINCNMSQPWFPITRSGGSILMYSPGRWAKAKKTAEENFPKSSALLRAEWLHRQNVLVPTVRERSLHHHTQHLSQAWRGTPRVHQRPLASIIPVCVSREVMKKIVQLWSVHRRTQGTYQVKPTCSYWVWLHKQECTIFTTCCTNNKYTLLYVISQCQKFLNVDVHLEHLYPNPLRRLPSILCEHHVQKPPAELLQKHQWTLLSGSYFCKSWTTRLLLALQK